MPTLTDFVVEIVRSTVDLLVIFVSDVALLDPLALLSWLVGLVVLAVSMAVFGYLTLGAVGSLFSFGDSLGRRPPQRGR